MALSHGFVRRPLSISAGEFAVCYGPSDQASYIEVVFSEDLSIKSSKTYINYPIDQKLREIFDSFERYINNSN